MEFWNNVFMQYERGPGTDKEDYPILGELPAKNIDTGMGLERMASILQGVDNLYEIDEVRPLLDKACELTGKRYGASHTHNAARVAPRRRAAARHRRPRAHLADADRRRRDPVQRGPRLRAAPHPAPGDPGDAPARLRGPGAAGAAAGGARQHVAVVPGARRPTSSRISQYAYAEEEAFRTTLRAGTTILDMAVADTKKSGGKTLARRQGVPAARHLRLPDRPDPGDRGRAGPVGRRRRASAGSWPSSASGPRPTRRRARPATPTCRRTGRRSTTAARWSSPATPRCRASRGCARCSARRRRSTAAGEGEQVEVVLDATPFYAEGGGQQPDLGLITVGGGKVEVLDVQQPVPGLIVHRARVLRGRGPRRRGRLRRDRRGRAAGRSPARTPRPTWCTRPCATSSASRRPRRVR